MLPKNVKMLLAFLFIFTALFSGTAFAATIERQSVVVEILEDSSTYWNVEILYKENVENSDFFILASIDDVEVMGGGDYIKCSLLTQGVGTSIACENMDQKNITYRFTAYNMVRNLGTAKMFLYSFPVTEIIESLEMTIKLPLGAGIVQKEDIGVHGFEPFSPPSGFQGTDGRQIFIKWQYQNPELGQAIEFYSIYEQIFGPEQFTIGIVTLIVIVAMIFITMFFRRKGKIDQVLPVLNENERKVMKIIIDSKGETEQKKIVRECDLSKSRISRILKDLEQRGLVKMTKRGRSNKVKLVFEKKAKKEE